MTKKEKFDFAVDGFEKLLIVSGLSEEYFLGFREEWLNGESNENYTRWKMWARNRPAHFWVSAAISWGKTPSGVDKWTHIDHVWLTWLCVNLYH